MVVKHALSYSDIRLGGMVGFHISEQYKNEVKKFLSGKLDRKYYTSESNKYSAELAKKMEAVMRLIRLKNNRLAILAMITFDELLYVREHKDEITVCDASEQITVLYAMLRTLTNIRQSIQKEFNHRYALRKRLLEENVDKNSLLGKALCYTLKKTIERFTGKDNPIEVLINEELKNTAYSAYGPKLLAANKTIWQDAAERTKIPLDPEAIKQSEMTPFEDERDKQERFRDIIEYCYLSGKVSYIERRTERYKKSEAKLAQEKAEKEEKRREKRVRTLDKHLNSAIIRHNNWYDHKDGSEYMPTGYTDILQECQDQDDIYLLLGVTKWKNGYREGYIETDLRSVNGRMLRAWHGKTAKDAEAARDDALNKGDILAATIICVADHMRTVEIAGDMEHLSPEQRVFLDLHSRETVSKEVIAEEYRDQIEGLYASGVSIEQIVRILSEKPGKSGGILPISRHMVERITKDIREENHAEDQGDLVIDHHKNEVLLALQNGGWNKELTEVLGSPRYIYRAVLKMIEEHSIKELGPRIQKIADDGKKIRGYDRESAIQHLRKSVPVKSRIAYQIAEAIYDKEFGAIW